jgi:Cyclin, C-terminal domain
LLICSKLACSPCGTQRYTLIQTINFTPAAMNISSLQSLAHDSNAHYSVYCMLTPTAATLNNNDRFTPSRLAAACVSLALHTLRQPGWSVTLQHETELSAPDLAKAVRHIAALQRSCETGSLRQVWWGYAGPDRMAVAYTVCLNKEEVAALTQHSAAATAAATAAALLRDSSGSAPCS